MSQSGKQSVPVSARVSPPLKDWLATEAKAHGMKPSPFTALVLARAAIRLDELDQLRWESCDKVRQLDELEQQLRAFDWFEGSLREQVELVLQNHQVLEQLFERFGNKPIQVTEAKRLGLRWGHLLATAKIDGVLYYIIGEYGWCYVNKEQTLLQVVRDDGNR